ncbi:MAG: hypothetical protein DRP15_00005 [Candidatus Aenigmatarchaeota archaeon]|nr:MAG: hypothetical protein DRP15_00005 [Candidatus Aenigmarchaeota archaeon]
MFWKKKKITYPKIWAVIDYCDTAKELCVGGSINLRIFLYERDRLVDVLPYSEAMVKILEEQGIPVVVKAKYNIPTECFEAPKRKVLFGRLRW